MADIEGCVGSIAQCEIVDPSAFVKTEDLLFHDGDTRIISRDGIPRTFKGYFVQAEVAIETGPLPSDDVGPRPLETEDDRIVHRSLGQSAPDVLKFRSERVDTQHIEVR